MPAPPEELRPTQLRKVIDLVREAGVDASRWADFKGGKARAAANPKYCHECSFYEPKKVVVLNIWFEEMVQQGQDIVIPLNLNHPHGGADKPRGQRTQERIKLAIRDKLPIRVIVLDGE